MSFQARPGVVIIGGSQNLGFMNDPVSCPCNNIAHYLPAAMMITPLQKYEHIVSSCYNGLPAHLLLHVNGSLNLASRMIQQHKSIGSFRSPL